MFTIHKESFEWGGRELTLETGKIARQADGSVLATYGETVVLATVVGAHSPKEGIDFFPLTVNYQERYYAAGKIPGGYFKRERAPTERETLISRLIDRPIRPLFAEGYRNETLVVVQVLSHDMENDPDVVGLVAASAALTISGIPFRSDSSIVRRRLSQRDIGRCAGSIPRHGERSRCRRSGRCLRRPDHLGHSVPIGFVHCSPKAIATRHWSLCRFYPTTWRTIPMSSVWSLPPPP